MAKKKRWGKKYVDNRDWKAYNAELVKRGEFYINPRFLETWLEEVEDMNHGKVGQPYLYPESLIEFLGVLKAKGFALRELEGIVQALSKRFNKFPVIVFSQIRRRILKLPLAFKAKGSNLVVGIDGSGMKVSNRGEWIRQKWAVRRGWIKVVILGDVEGNIVDMSEIAFGANSSASAKGKPAISEHAQEHAPGFSPAVLDIRVGNEDVDERSAGRGMIRDNKENINKVLADGLHDCGATFDLCDKFGFEAGIKIRENADESGLGRRPDEVRLYKNLGYKGWAKAKEYGKRWLATEGIFSASKRIMGECVNAHKKRNMYKEARLKFWAYQQVKDAGAG